MVDPVQVYEAEAKAEVGVITAHNVGWLRTNWPWLIGLVVAFALGHWVR